MKQKLTTIGLLMLTAQSMIAQDLGSVASSLQSNTSNITSIVNTFITWVSIIFGIASFVKLIQIFTSQGSGEDKINKAGTWIFMLIFCAVGFTLTRILFKA